MGGNRSGGWGYRKGNSGKTLLLKIFYWEKGYDMLDNVVEGNLEDKNKYLWVATKAGKNSSI